MHHLLQKSTNDLLPTISIEPSKEDMEKGERQAFCFDFPLNYHCDSLYVKDNIKRRQYCACFYFHFFNRLKKGEDVFDVAVLQQRLLCEIKLCYNLSIAKKFYMNI